MPVLAVLRHEEGVRLDPNPLVALYSELGPGAADRLIVRAADDLGGRLSEVFRHSDEGRQAAVAKSARALERSARQIGMATLARVAGDVVAVTETGDMTAQAATLARLFRIGDRSLLAVWDLRMSV